MNKIVFFTDLTQLSQALDFFKMSSFAQKIVPVKLHMGEPGNKYFPQPALARPVVEELKKDAEVVKVEDLQEIVNRGVMMTPAVSVDGEIKIVGHVPSEAEVKKILS